MLCKCIDFPYQAIGVKIGRHDRRGNPARALNGSSRNAQERPEIAAAAEVMVNRQLA